MRVKSFLILSVITVAAAATAAVMVGRTPGPAVIAGAGEPVLPALRADPNRVDAIRIVSGDRSISLDRDDGGWVIADRDRYPASFERIKALIVGLAQLEKREPKTEQPSRHASIGVEDAGPGAQSTEVTLTDAAGQPVARILLGEETQAGGEGRYVRIPGEARAWLASGTVAAVPEVVNWADPQVIDVPDAEIRSVRIRRPEGGTIALLRRTPEAREFVLEDVPPGRSPAPGTSETVGDALAGVELEDVRPAAAVAFAPAEMYRIRFETFDGLVVGVDLVQRDGAAWIRLAPEAGEGASPEVKARAAALAGRTAGWAYRVPDWRFGQFRRPLNDWLLPEKSS
jgi:hypothetical protein